MYKTFSRLYFALIFFSLFLSLNAMKVTISKEEICDIGYRIYKNECGLKPENLTHWNEGEGFASLGIGHFLWYPAGSKRIHDATFPLLLTFLKQNRVRLPAWLDNNYQVCPWSSKTSFEGDFNSAKMKSIRDLLQQTMYQQTLFIIYRFNNSIPRLIQAAKRDNMEQHVTNQLYRVARSYMGMYVLIDYSNFKGTGTNPGSGQWGLLQVLENMQGTQTGRAACYDFAKSASLLLKKRVLNSANRSQEEKWYPGWLKRLETYYN